MGIKQGFLGGVTLGVTNCVAFFTCERRRRPGSQPGPAAARPLPPQLPVTGHHQSCMHASEHLPLASEPPLLCILPPADALALWYGARRVAAGAYTGGDVLNVLFAALFGGFALGQAAPNLQYFAQASGAGGRIFAVLARQPTIDVDAPGASGGL